MAQILGITGAQIRMQGDVGVDEGQGSVTGAGSHLGQMYLCSIHLQVFPFGGGAGPVWQDWCRLSPLLHFLPQACFLLHNQDNHSHLARLTEVMWAGHLTQMYTHAHAHAL